MQNDNDPAKEFKDKIDTLLKELDDNQSDKIWKGTLRQSANVLKKRYRPLTGLSCIRENIRKKAPAELYRI